MKKQLVASLAAAMVLGVAGSAFAAANPFVDVPAKHWSYDSVTKLAQAGVIDGYGDGTFRGDKTVTRYEMAQMVAKAMGNEGKATAVQKAEIKKLVAEYSDELDKLGVRLAAVEKNQANLKFNGTADVRYTSQDYVLPANATVAQGQYRLRLDGSAKVDDKTTFGLRLTNQVTKAGTSTRYLSSGFTTFGTEQAGAATTTSNGFDVDRLFLTTNIGAVKTTVGAQKLALGTTALIVDSGAYSFDGARLEAKSGVVNLATNWGRQQKTTNATTLDVVALDVASLEASTTSGKLSYGLGYATVKDNGTYEGTVAKYEYGNALYKFDKMFALQGEYVQNKADYATSDNSAWVATATYGDYSPAAKGQQNLVVKYYTIGQNSISRLTNFDLTKAKAAAVTEIDDVVNQKALNVTYNYAFSNNLLSYVTYAKLTDKDATATADTGYSYWRVGLTAKF